MSGPTTKKPFPGIGSIGSATAVGAKVITAMRAASPATDRRRGITDMFPLAMSSPTLMSAYARTTCATIGSPARLPWGEFRSHNTPLGTTRIGSEVTSMPEGKPNILVIWGDDIGITNLSCYSDGLMGYRTPNIDRIAQEGMRFTDSYGEQSCTAGRSSFITGQSVYRTGLSKVGMPGVDVGLSAEDPTIAELLKPLGYATGQFGKNHLGDLNKHLPTAHGFDEFFGNLYHLNAEEEPENPNYPTAEEAPRLPHHDAAPRVIRSWATEEVSDEVDERYGPVGRQRIEDTGPLTRKRMETIDDETTSAAIDFIKRQHDADTPFFVWMNTTHALPAPTPNRRASVRLAAGSPVPRHDDRSRQSRRPAAGLRRRTQHRRGHHRHLLHRQRPAREQLAGRRDHPVPQ